jgi:hypothetical protein
MLRGQLMNRKRKKNDKGKLAVESKEDMKARGVPSPDRADALIGCLAPTGGFGFRNIDWVIPVQRGDFESINGSPKFEISGERKSEFELLGPRGD